MKFRAYVPLLLLCVWQVQAQKTVTVAQGGSGDYRSVQQAIDDTPASGGVIRITPGTYKEHITVDKPSIQLAGTGRTLPTTAVTNVTAERLMVGYTVSEPGNWTSWPPHEHTGTLEEMYVYFDMPEPAFGIQVVYNNTEYPELVTVVRDGDAVLMPSGYPPNVSVPGHRICFLWAMAAHREVTDRQYGVVNVQPDFK